MYALLETSRSCLSHIFMMICTWGWKWKILCCHGMHTKGIHERISACFVDFLSMHTQLSRKKTIAMIYLHNFSAEKKSGNWRENLHAPKNTNCAFCLSATQIAEWNTCEYLRFIMLYIIASPENRQRVRFIVEI